MSTKRLITPRKSDESAEISKLLNQYGCGPIQFVGADNALYERHLLFDAVVDLKDAGPRERFEAVARSVRDILSQRWVHTENTYRQQNPKRVYYLSMEFLIGRTLANNVTNLLLDPLMQQAVTQKNLDWLELVEQEPDAGLGYGLRYEYGIFKQSIQDGWQREEADNWLRRQDPWEVARPHEQVEVRLNC